MITNVFKILDYKSLTPWLKELQVQLIDRDFNKTYRTYRLVEKSFNEDTMFQIYSDGGVEVVFEHEIKSLFIYAAALQMYNNSSSDGII